MHRSSKKLDTIIASTENQTEFFNGIGQNETFREVKTSCEVAPHFGYCLLHSIATIDFVRQKAFSSQNSASPKRPRISFLFNRCQSGLVVFTQKRLDNLRTGRSIRRGSQATKGSHV
jgi:hypothetical protein